MQLLTLTSRRFSFILTYGLPFSVTFVRPDQAAASYTLPAGSCNYLRWVTTALCCTGYIYTLRASGLTTQEPDADFFFFMIVI